MLALGGYINILIAVGHIVGLIWADKMFEVTGIGNEMKELARSHFSLPYLLTIFVAIIFFIFGLYGLSAANKIKRLPFLKLGVFVIAGVYLLRGFGELLFDMLDKTSTLAETTYSLAAVTIGLLFLIGGLKKWSMTATNK